MKEYRKVVRIDEEKCDGCGLCVPSCAEGAIRVVDGKARLVSETYCDGLGACLGECPQGAITIEEREADVFDEGAVKEYLVKRQEEIPAPPAAPPPEFRGCPGSLARMLGGNDTAREKTETGAATEQLSSRLRNWPVQLKLAPLSAPYFQGAKLLVSADCAAYSYADFHRGFMEDRTVLIGCPKLDDVELYLNKLRAIFAGNDIRSVEVLYMEVPCCGGLVQLVRRALEESGKSVPLRLVRIGIRGDILEEREFGMVN